MHFFVNLFFVLTKLMYSSLCTNQQKVSWEPKHCLNAFNIYINAFSKQKSMTFGCVCCFLAVIGELVEEVIGSLSGPAEDFFFNFTNWCSEIQSSRSKWFLIQCMSLAHIYYTFVQIITRNNMLLSIFIMSGTYTNTTVPLIQSKINNHLMQNLILDK